MKALRYKPNRVARRLRAKGGDRKLLGLLIPDIQNPFYVEVIRGVEDAVYENDYAVFICNYAQNYEKEKFYLNILKAESIDGLIVAPYSEDDDIVEALVRQGMPIVCVDRGLVNVDADLVVVDNRKAAETAVDHLIGLGHARIGFVGGLYTIPTSRSRRDGYINSLNKAGIPVDNDLIHFGDSRHESGKKIVESLIQMNHPPTAIFTSNNVITLGALEVIHSAGIKVPEEMAIIGFDDMYWAISLNPPLTAVMQPGYEIGKQAVEMLFSRFANPERETRKVVLKTRLMVRKSCGFTL